MKGIKILFATLFVFLFCNTAFAAESSKSLNLMAGQNDLTAFGADDGLVNYRRGADDGATPRPDDKKGRGRGRTGSEISDVTDFQMARRGADDGAAPDDNKGRGRGHGADDPDSEISDVTSFQMVALTANDALVNYRRGADDGAAPDDKKGRGRGHGRDD